VARGEAQTGPTVPLVQASSEDYEPSPNVRQVYPPLSEAQQQEQQKQAQLQANQLAEEEKTKTQEETTSSTASSPQQGQTEQKEEITPEEEEKIVESVIKQLQPLVEQFVAAEIRRVLRGQTDSDDDTGFMSFPFMFGGGPIFSTSRAGPPPQGFQQQQQRDGVRVRTKR
jgi:hypothetical protein